MRSFKRQDILLRAGANFQVDITMKLASLSETITVSGESPMLEVSNPSNVLNISGEFQREMPIQARRNWSDFLEITPGVHSRPFDDGSGRMVYFGHSTEHFAHVVQLEGAIASNYQDAQITYVAMGADMVSDTQVKTGGVDASAPMGVGLNINVITKSGGNTFKGSGAFAYQPRSWNGNNVANCSPSASCKPATVDRRRHADDGHHPAVRRRRRRTDPARQGLVLRLGAARRPRSGHQPDSRGSRSASRLSIRTPSCSTTPRRARSRTGK